MKGDFSEHKYDPTANFTGTLYQQGRAFSDQDGNAADAIGRHLRTLLGRDTIGPGVVAIPAGAGGALQVLNAQSDGNRVRVAIAPGRGWVDGLHLYLPGSNPLTRGADYLGPPVHSPAPSVAGIAAGIRDAVILEVWEEALSAFQAPQDLIEPALGGPDTTERVVLHHRLRLLRLKPDEHCGNIGPRLAEDLAAQGRLTVTPAPTQVTGGDCPVQLGGGYTGFEHLLYRIEVAEPDANDKARFKYSRYNGGLVGRGVLGGTAQDEILIRANDQMINLSQLGGFYLEVLTPGPAADPGYWRVAMTADASLVADGRLSLVGIRGSWPGLPGEEAFFRLWDGVRRIEEFPTGLAQPNELELGIRLAFEPPASDLGNYRPGDYWTFPVRAAGVDFDPSSWPDKAPPAGVPYHRAPLAILNWNAGPVAVLTGAPDIQDCRRTFHPLTRGRTCCSFKVGDGSHSQGDFVSIQAALDHLPPEGGEICVLPGTYRENIQIERDGVRILGCGERSRVVPVGIGPVFHIAGHSRIRIEGLLIEADKRGAGVLVETDTRGIEPADIALRNLDIQAAQESAIKVLGSLRLQIRDCRIDMADLTSPWHAIYLRAREALIEHNRVRVTATAQSPDGGALGGIGAGRGGIQIAGTCERVRVIDNLIVGGIGNGITLGSLEELRNGQVVDSDPGWVIGKRDPCDPCAPGSTFLPPSTDEPDEPEYRSAGALYEIRIERNRILDMGLSGIGVVAFFDLTEADELISVDGLDILGNEVRGCLVRALQAIPEDMRDSMGYGAVTLADVESLRCYDNLVEDNGPDHQYPVCGLFVLQAEAADICRNRILRTGAKTDLDVKDAMAGRRGGIVILNASPGLVPVRAGDLLYPRQGGEPAARIHHNMVSQPLGQALYLRALGPVSVQGNQLTSRGVTARRDDPGFSAAAVWILNLGLSNETWGQILLFSGNTADPIEARGLVGKGVDSAQAPAPGLDDSKRGQYLANGNLSFNDNQVLTDLIEPDVVIARSSVLILSLDDVAVQDNQLDCDLLGDALATNLIAAGMTLRIGNNRFKESLYVALSSWIAVGLLCNNSSQNQSTHCYLNLTSPLARLDSMRGPRIIEEHNQILYAYLDPPSGDDVDRRTCSWLDDRYKNRLISDDEEHQGANVGIACDQIEGAIASTLAHCDSTRAEGLEAMNQVKRARLIQFRRERARRAERHGEGSEPAAEIDRRLAVEHGTLVAGRAELDRVRTPPVERKSDAWQLHGYLRSPDGFARGHHTVSLYPDAEGIEPPLTSATTSSTGYFRLSLERPAEPGARSLQAPTPGRPAPDAGTTEQAAGPCQSSAALKTPIFLGTRGGSQAIPVVQTRALHPVPGAIAYRDLILRNEEDSGSECHFATRLLGNSSSRSLHDLANEQRSCRLAAIRPDRRVYFQSEAQAEKLGYDRCAHCFGKGRSKG